MNLSTIAISLYGFFKKFCDGNVNYWYLKNKKDSDRWFWIRRIWKQVYVLVNKWNKSPNYFELFIIFNTIEKLCEF